jgi:hypothetical protein
VGVVADPEAAAVLVASAPGQDLVSRRGLTTPLPLVLAVLRQLRQQERHRAQILYLALLRQPEAEAVGHIQTLLIRELTTAVTVVRAAAHQLLTTRLSPEPAAQETAHQ